jgi:hypothetical protein
MSKPSHHHTLCFDEAARPAPNCSTGRVAAIGGRTHAWHAWHEVAAAAETVAVR